MTLIVNHKAKAIPSDKWQMIQACAVNSSVQIMQPFTVRDDDGIEQHGNAGDFIVELGNGQWVIVPTELHARLFVAVGEAA